MGAWPKHDGTDCEGRLKSSVLFVCMGNICRSPTAEGVFAHWLSARNLESIVRVDSAGTHGYHVGAPPDVRTQAAAARRGYDLRRLRARAVCDADFERFDLILAMDRANLSWLKARCPDHHHQKLKLFLDFAPNTGVTEVPDPYYGGEDGFEHVLDLIEDAAQGLLAHVTVR